jgi:spore coat polysaccharide biosynthesis protein SpsF
VKVGAVIQARMGSSRLPGKVLLDIAGTPMLGRVVDRARRGRSVNLVIVATTTGPQDDPLAAYARSLSVDVFRGDENDVLDRYYQAAKAFDLDVVARITSDCPLLDPGILDTVVQAVIDAGEPVDFCSNTLQRRFPRGLDVEVAPLATLDRLWRTALLPHYRAHVFPYIYEHPAEFVTRSVTDTVDRSYMRWTVDTDEDLRFVREVYRQLRPEPGHWRDVVALLERQPELLQINEAVRQKTAHE